MNTANLNFYIGVPVEDWPKSIGLKTYSANADGLVNSGILKSGKHFYKKWDHDNGKYSNPRFVIEGSKDYASNPPSRSKPMRLTDGRPKKSYYIKLKNGKIFGAQGLRHTFDSVSRAQTALRLMGGGGKIMLVKSNPRRRTVRRSRRNMGSFSRRIRPARSIAHRLKIYGGAKLRKYGSKIVKRNGCGCKRKR